MASYQWQYMGMPISATFDGNLSVKHGLRTMTAPVHDITGFYVDLGAQNSQYAYQQLIVAYRAPGETKTKAVRAYASMHQPQFTALVDALAAAKPNVDLRKLPRAEAFKQLGVADVQKVTLIALPVVVLAVMLIAFAPFGLHGLDKGEERVSVEELGKKSLSSRNLVLSGELETRNYLEVTHTKNGVKQSSEYFFPVYAPGAPDDAFVPVVLKTRELSSAQLRTLANATEWRCTLRNIWWEGLSSGDRDYFHDQLKVNVTGDTLLCEHVNKNVSDGLMFGLIVGITFLLMAGVSFALWLKRSK